MKAQKNAGDRYAVLQRKVDDLERVHNDSKKSYLADVDRLKTELARFQKTNAEQSDKLDKQKKTVDILEARTQDLKRTFTNDQAEIKDLRAKLRASEQERTQASTKLAEAADVRKSLHALDLRRKEELEERERRIAELEKMLATEKNRNQATEIGQQKAVNAANDELQAARTNMQQLQRLLDESWTRSRDAEDALALAKLEAEAKNNDFISQLEPYKNVVKRVTEEYGRLASTTVSAASYKQLQDQYAASQIRVSRLERKSANSDAQVVELVHLVRQAKEQNGELMQLLRETEYELTSYASAFRNLGTTSIFIYLRDLALDSELLQTVGFDLITLRQVVEVDHKRTTELTCDLWSLVHSDLLFEYSASQKQLAEERIVSQRHVDTRSTLETLVQKLRNERATIDDQLTAATDLANSLKASAKTMEKKIVEMEKAGFDNAATLKKEKEISGRLDSALHKARVAEEALRKEIDLLTSDLADAAKYQEAYFSLYDEVGKLVARNQLAEEEAQKLSRFNAEILSHQNPAQRIMYVDRIRRELAEVKHKFVLLTRDHEVITAANEQLQRELEIYKSVGVDQKPRTNFTRIARQPVEYLDRSLNVYPSTDADNLRALWSGKGADGGNSVLEILETGPGDMTIDEIS